MKEKIRVTNLRKSFGDKTILDGLSFHVNESEVLCIIGQSGTGKSVTLKLLVGMLIPDAGSIFVDDENYVEATISRRREIESKYGILFQGAALFDSMNIYDNVAFGMRRRGASEDEIAEAVPRLLESVGLKNVEDKRVSEISGGMQKRVGLARALALKPEIMLYDEPTTGVDPITGGAVDRLIVGMRDIYGITSVVVTHDMTSACRIADRIIMLYKGRELIAGTPNDVMNSEDPIVRQFTEGRADGPIKIM